MTHHEWTPSGLNLLKTITDEIARYGHVALLNTIQQERVGSYICRKKHCAYCELINRKP